MQVLVGYASAKGSTRGVAERIAARLESAGHSAVVHTAAEMPDPSGYDAVVLGSAIHNQNWLPEAADAVERFRPELGGRKAWAFSVSSVGATSSTIAPWLARFLRPRTPEPKAVQALRHTADVRGHRFFAGAITPGDWPGIGKLVFLLMGGHYGDARDWKDIDIWADVIAYALDTSTEQA